MHVKPAGDTTSEWWFGLSVPLREALMRDPDAALPAELLDELVASEPVLFERERDATPEHLLWELLPDVRAFVVRRAILYSMQRTVREDAARIT